VHQGPSQAAMRSHVPMKTGDEVRVSRRGVVGGGVGGGHGADPRNYLDEPRTPNPKAHTPPATSSRPARTPPSRGSLGQSLESQVPGSCGAPGDQRRPLHPLPVPPPQWALVRARCRSLPRLRPAIQPPPPPPTHTFAEQEVALSGLSGRLPELPLVCSRKRAYPCPEQGTAGKRRWVR
jgi:hypothetical protein